MPLRSRSSPPVRRPRATRLAWVIVPALLLAGCTEGSDEPSGPTSTTSTTSQAELDLSGLPIPRADACELLDEDDVTQALGEELADTDHYSNGEEVEVVPGVVDVSHEYGCVFEGSAGTVARLWVFARPVTGNEAETLVRRSRRGRDCAFPETVVYGTPGLNSVCEVPAGDAQGTMFRARFEGLFTDTWLGCEVSDPATEQAEGAASDPTAEPEGPAVGRAHLLERAEQWCVGAAMALSAAS